MVILAATFTLLLLLSLICPQLLAHFVNTNHSLLLGPASRLCWPQRSWLLFTGPLFFVVCDVAVTPLYCPTGGLGQRACVASVVAAVHMNTSAAVLQLILQGLVAGAQADIIQQVRHLGEEGSRSLLDFQWILDYYRDLQERTSSLNKLKPIYPRQGRMYRP